MRNFGSKPICRMSKS